jgi:electron transfer flavoprotein alpha subunit
MNLILRRLFSSHSFVVGDHASGKLSKSTVQVVQAARKLNGKVTIGLFGADESVAKEAAKLKGVNSVVSIQCASHLPADAMSKGITDLAKKLTATHILGSTSSTMKDSIPRVGALMDSQPISDVIEIISESKFKRPMYAGNVIATVESRDNVKILTVRTTAFPVPSDGISDSACEIEKTEISLHPSAMTVVSEETRSNDKVDLGTARVVISGGRALKSKENFDNLLNPLAAKLNAAVGASRAAVDAGFAANDLQVGQTGKVVAPDLYVAIGISGAIQHAAGMKDSRTIVCINKDKDCPMMQMADYGLVGDIFQIIPELTQKI